MKNGYYLSTYVHIDELAFCFKLKIRHDQNIALWKYKKGRLFLIRYWELERITGFKHHSLSFRNHQDFNLFLNELLGEFNLSLDNIEGIWEKKQSLFTDVLWYNQISYHNLAHIFSALLSNTKDFNNENILVMAVDGGPDSVGLKEYEINFSGVYSSKGVIKGYSQISSPGPLWSSTKLIFNLEEGSLMALMSASKSQIFNYNKYEYLDIVDFDSAIKAYDVILDICKYVWTLSDSEEGKKYNFWDKRFSVEENRISMVMKVVFELSCKIMYQNIEKFINQFDIDPQKTLFSVVGGFGLNCPSNSVLMKKYRFKKFIEVPCTNDSGISLGIGLLETYLQNNRFEFCLNTAYYGSKFLGDNYKKLAECQCIKSIESEYSDECINDDLNKGPIVWISDEMEIGPRALGHRSLLALTRKQDKDRLNLIKGRQWWRPVAPIVLLDKLESWFEGDEESKFMLRTYALKEVKEDVYAICHLDNSARVQTVSKKDNEKLYNILKMVDKKTGIPILCNTSLNDIDEPIINSLERVINFALEKDICTIYLNGKRIVLNLDNKIFFRIAENTRFFYNVSKNKMKELNPYGLDTDELQFYINTKSLHNLGLNAEKDVRIIKKLFTYKAGKVLGHGKTYTDFGV